MTWDDFYQQLWLGAAAFLGVMARAQKWTTAEGKIDYRKAVFELAAAPAIGIMASSLTYVLWPELDPRIMGGIAALLGLLGPAAIEVAVLKFIDRKTGG